MNESIPKRLGKEPLIEVAWEVRFISELASVVDLLPGILFSRLNDHKMVRLPFADIPFAISSQDPKIRYIPRFRLEKDNLAVQIAENAVSVSYRRPYPGWDVFYQSIREVTEILRQTKFINRINRFSLKYTNLMVVTSPPDLNCLNVKLGIDGFENAGRLPLQLRTEIRQDNLVHVIQIGSPAKVTLPGQPTEEGILLNIDTIREMKDDEGLNDMESYLDSVHHSSKNMFFSLLTRETLEFLEPEYEENIHGN